MGAVVRALREENARLRARVADLEALVKKLLTRIEILEKALGSGPGGPAPIPPTAPPSIQKPRGRPPGHEGTSWSMPSVKPQVVELRLQRCPECGGRLSGRGDFQEHTVIDLPEKIEPIVTRYRHERRYCARCKKTVRAPLAADEPPNGHFGMRVLTLIAQLKTKAALPFTKIHDVLGQVFGIEIPRSTLPSMVVRVGQWLAPVHRHLIEAVRKSRVAYADETTWPVSGKNGWAWLFATKKITAFVMEPTRSAAVPKRVLGEPFAGTLVSDDYPGYHGLTEEHQTCWAHLLRETKEVAAAHPSAVAERLRQRLHAIFQEAEIVSAARDCLTPEVLDQEIARVDSMLANLCKGRSHVPAVEHVKNRIARRRRALLTYLRCPGVEPTNNLGERRIRQLVLVRKVSGGSRSWTGARAHGAITSCIDSLGHLKTTLLDLIRRHATRAACREHLVSILSA